MLPDPSEPGAREGRDVGHRNAAVHLDRLIVLIDREIGPRLIGISKDLVEQFADPILGKPPGDVSRECIGGDAHSEHPTGSPCGTHVHRATESGP